MSVDAGDDLEFLREQVEALKQLGQRESVSEGDIYDFSIRWGTALAGRLPRLVHYSSMDRLDRADETAFASLCDDLRALAALIGRFKLAEPELPTAAT